MLKLTWLFITLHSNRLEVALNDATTEKKEMEIQLTDLQLQVNKLSEGELSFIFSVV